jgi:NAD-dependent deacetylase
MMKFSRYIFLILSAVFCLRLNAFDETYFSKPVPYSKQEFLDELERKTLDMCWNFGSDSHFRFVSSNGEIYFEICLGTLPEIYDEFLSRVKHKFVQKGTKQLVFSYKVKADGQEEINLPSPSKIESRPDEYSYIVADRRVMNDAQPSRIDQAALEEIIKNKKVLFYTGAGLSVASDVPAMNELNELLGLESGSRFLFSLEKAIESPRSFVEKIRTFHHACLYSAPTPAHEALKELSLFKMTRVLTENLDCLHEASGISPYRIDAKHLREEIGEQSVLQFDYVVCIGLSFDDRGFLGWYKKQNPQGKIIAVDIQQPSYLGDEDFWVQGDLQVLVPELQKEVLKGHS